MKKIKINLRQLLKERNMTQTELSTLSNVTQSKISCLCNNKLKELNIGILERISTALAIQDISELIELVDEGEEVVV